ncbi:hypothetical protein K435DRAFT_287217, partial [Dendrothele bispora CBS 962.96]
MVLAYDPLYTVYKSTYTNNLGAIIKQYSFLLLVTEATRLLLLSPFHRHPLHCAIMDCIVLTHRNGTELTLHSPDIELIDREIEKHQNIIRDLKTRRNLHASISKLPPEILSTIFLLYNDGIPYNHCDHWHSLAWIRVSHICRHWRNVALGCPALWSHLNFFMPASVPEMLLRSKSAPLTIQFTLSYYGASKMIEAFHTSLEQVARIRELSIVITGHNFERLFPRTDQAAPHLQKLVLNSLLDRMEVIALPKDFLDGRAPCLSHLELRNIHLPWSSPLLKNLTTLKLTRTRLNSQTTLPTLDQLVEMLGRMPGLETLELENVLPSSGSSISEVTLPYLRDIQLGGDIAGCANVLNLISFPYTARMKFGGVVDGHAASALDVATLFPPVLSKIRRRLCEDDVISSLSISCNFADITIR